MFLEGDKHGPPRMLAPVCVGLERDSAEKENAVASCSTVPDSKTA